MAVTRVARCNPLQQEEIIYWTISPQLGGILTADRNGSTRSVLHAAAIRVCGS